MAWLERWRRRRECSDTVPATVPESATLEREPPVVAVHEEPADEMQEALTALRAAAVGGSTAFHGDVMRWLTEAGVAEVVDVQPPAGGSPFLAGMRPV